MTETGTLMHTGTITITGIRAWSTGAESTLDSYVQLFDALSASVGTDVPDWVVHLVEGDNLTSGDGLPTDGLVFRTGIFVAATLGAGDNGAPQIDPHVRITYL